MQDEKTEGRKVSLKGSLIAVGVVVLIGLVVWGWQSLRLSRTNAVYNQHLRDSAALSAETVGRAIAAFGNKQIVAENWESLQEYADDLVKTESVTYVAILNSEGVAVVHTDRGVRGSPLSKPEQNDMVAHASVPVMNVTRQVATVRIGVNAVQP